MYEIYIFILEILTLAIRITRTLKGLFFECYTLHKPNPFNNTLDLQLYVYIYIYHEPTLNGSSDCQYLIYVVCVDIFFFNKTLWPTETSNIL